MHKSRIPLNCESLAPRRWVSGGVAVLVAVALWHSLVVRGQSLFEIGAVPVWLFLPILVAAIFNLLLYVIGFLLWWRDGEGRDVGNTDVSGRTALVMPVYNEDVARISGGIKTTWRSCARHGLIDRTDFFLLSDSTDARIRSEEEALCERLACEFGDNEADSGRLFMVRRSERTNYKAGNVMNFLENHGDAYDYMLVLDADSVMMGGTIRRLIQRMDSSPKTAIVQSLMLPIRSVAPFSKAMQYGIARSLPLFTRGVYWFFGGDSVYWGHNALIRIQPFRRHCRLPQLPGKPPLGGAILSQDIVEAAFLGRAGWRVDWESGTPGSFDEMPANLLTYGDRDRRWCHGNFQHSHFLFSRGMRFGHRLQFANGIFSYCAGPALLCLIAAGLVQVYRNGSAGFAGNPVLVGASMGLFWLLMLTPRCLGLVRAFSRGRLGKNRNGTATTGRFRNELGSAALELMITLLTGPLLFFLHARFLLEIVLGKTVTWKNQPRDPRLPVAWRSAARVFWPATLLGAAALWMSARAGWETAALLAPISASWIFSIPTTVWSSMPEWGEALIRWKLFSDLFSEDELDCVRSLDRETPRGEEGSNPVAAGALEGIAG